MKTILPVLAILAAAASGCAGGGVTREEFKELQQRVERESLDAKTDRDRMLDLWKRVVESNKDLMAKIEKLEMTVKVYESRIDRLEAALRSGGGGSNPGNGGTEKKTPSVDPIARTAEVLLDLRIGKARPEDAVAALKPIARDAVPLLLEELKKNIAEIKYAVQLEQVLSKLPPGDLKIPLGKALEDRTLRQSAARIMGAAGDKELSKALENYTSVSDEDFRLEVGAALVQCKNAAGIPPLVQSLRSTDFSTRVISRELLKKINKGQDYGYKADATLEQNAEAIKQWEEWAEKFGKTIFE